MDYKRASAFLLGKMEAELSGNLFYHGIHHTRDVIKAAQDIAEEEHITGEELCLLKTAALFHDAGYLLEYEDNEKPAADLAEEYLPAFGYQPDQIEMICQIILSTGKNTAPQHLLEQILCDADHDYLGRPDFSTVAATLLKELKAYGYDYTDEQWDKIQLRYLQSHSYYTPGARKKRDARKALNSKEVEERLRTYEQES